MSLDTDLLGNCGLRFESEIFTDGSYSLSRVDYQGRKLVAEISDATGVYQHRWPSVGGLIPPVSARDLPGEQRLLLFDIGDGKFLCEQTREIGRFSSERAIHLTRMVLRIVSDLQAAGMICGYIGPEMFVSYESSIALLAGRRGVPLSPFTAPEVQSSRPSDPRSDVSAIGSFLFRLVAGTDAREDQLRVWKDLTPELQTSIQDMVAASPLNRPNGMKAVLAILDNLSSQQIAEESAHDDSGFVRKGKKAKSNHNRRKWYWIIGSVAVLVLGFFAVVNSGLPPDPDFSTDTEEEILPEEDIQEVVSPWVDTVSVEDTVLPDAVVPIIDSARIWISNCSGTPDVEFAFRASSVSQYSYTYPLSGTTKRASSLILAMRSDPTVPIADTPLGQAAYQIADTSFTVKAVDLTIMLGTDLSYPGINAHFLRQPVAPAGTLFVDVVNHGIQYSLDGMGAATWVATRIDGKSCQIGEIEWLIAITDIRDADRFNEEIGIPQVLDETIFLHKEGNLQAGSLETILRQYFQPLPGSSEFPVETIPLPDIHVLISETFTD